MKGYRTWGQVAGYFDGDGSVLISDTSNQPYALGLSLQFVDQSFEQISMLRKFLTSRGVMAGNILKTSKGTAFMLSIGRRDSVLKMLRAILPLLYKKSNEAKAVLDYYEGRITGNDLARVFKNEVEAGRRERRPRKVPIDVPYARPDGDRLMRLKKNFAIRDAMGRYRSRVTPEDYQLIREKYFSEEKKVSELVKEFPQYARETIRRILGKGRGYVLVKGKGLVHSTNST